MAAILVYGTVISSFLFKYFVLFHHPTGATDHVSENDLLINYMMHFVIWSFVSKSNSKDWNVREWGTFTWCIYNLWNSAKSHCQNAWNGISETLASETLACLTPSALDLCLKNPRSAPELLHATWLSLSEDQIVETFLYGSEILGYEENQILMRHVQLFILQTKRFTSLIEY
jgi:hypothetical protein